MRKQERQKSATDKTKYLIGVHRWLTCFFLMAESRDRMSAPIPVGGRMRKPKQNPFSGLRSVLRHGVD
jgi:hypothetical protein